MESYVFTARQTKTQQVEPERDDRQYNAQYQSPHFSQPNWTLKE